MDSFEGTNLNNQSVQNKPTTAYTISLLGGVFGLLGSLAFIAFGVLAYLAISSFDYYYSYGIDTLFGWGWTTLLGLGLWVMVASILIIVFAGKLKANPMEHTKWGALILVFSIIGLWSLLGFIGGILALVYKPIPAGQAQPYGYGPAPQQPYGQPSQYYNQPAPVQASQPMTRICPQCGRVVDENVKYCPYCGKL
jgi:hypothetical protein